uniref:Uncharacterized protein n=1 Tax=Pristionchus pacificus TaxID=54126 RepID=A0A2A6BA33_PRIPA|eukprot:PDM62711.1 hypothetical protein PRIPAC_49926 [Pristionchus pacificus]
MSSIIFLFCSVLFCSIDLEWRNLTTNIAIIAAIPASDSRAVAVAAGLHISSWQQIRIPLNTTVLLLYEKDCHINQFPATAATAASESIPAALVCALIALVVVVVVGRESFDCSQSRIIFSLENSVRTHVRAEDSGRRRRMESMRFLFGVIDDYFVEHRNSTFITQLVTCRIKKLQSEKPLSFPILATTHNTNVQIWVNYRRLTE